MAGRITIFDRILIFLFPVAIIFYFLKIYGINIPVLSCYLNDLLFIPVLISLVAFIFNRVLKIAFAPDLFHIIFAVVACSIYFEYYLPEWNPNYTSDGKDVLCYFTGGIVIAVIPEIFKQADR